MEVEHVDHIECAFPEVLFGLGTMAFASRRIAYLPTHCCLPSELFPFPDTTLARHIIFALTVFLSHEVALFISNARLIYLAANTPVLFFVIVFGVMQF